MPTLNSSWMDSADFNDGTLYITCRNGRSYMLRGVPEHHYLGLITSASPGQYFNAYLKGRY